MTGPQMSPARRVRAALAGGRPDRIPLALLLTVHGARELGIEPARYFERAEHVVEGQLRLQRKYRHDVLYAFFHAALEIEAWGGEVIPRDDGPPLPGEPPIRDLEQLRRLEPPTVDACPGLLEALRAVRGLREAGRGELPVLGTIVSPFALPILQLGFGRYLELLYEDPGLLRHLLEVNLAFSVAWGRALAGAGADALGLFDPLASPAMLPPLLYRRVGLPWDRATVRALPVPVLFSTGGAPVGPVLDEIASTGAAAVAVGPFEDLAAIGTAAEGRMAVAGNLDGISMRRWSRREARERVAAAVAAGGCRGFLLSDGHGEIPLQVPDEVLAAVAEAARELGRHDPGPGGTP